MRIVVTGATSFLGSHLVKRLLQEGHRVCAVVRPHSSNMRALQQKAEEAGKEAAANLQVLELELSQLDLLSGQLPEGAEIFFHFGWDGSGSKNRQNPELQQKNAELGMIALESAAALGCKRFLFSGSQAEYGVCRTVITEATPCDPVSEYGKAKIAFARRAKAMVKQWKDQGRTEMEFIHTRIFSVYGPGDHPASLVNSCVRTFLQNGKMEMGPCTQKWNYLYIDDLVEALAALAFCRDFSGLEDLTFNIAGGEEATKPLREYVDEIWTLCGERGEKSYGVMPFHAEGPANLIPDITRIRTCCGWEPETDFKKGITILIESMKNEEIL